jgi:hypothetical protein
MAIDDPPNAPDEAPKQTVHVLLVYADGRRCSVPADAAVLAPHVLLVRGGAVFSNRGDDLRFGKWHRLFVQCDVIELR